MNPIEYRKKMEQKLVSSFLENFHSKMGYYPTVITNDQELEMRNSINILSLNELEESFKPFLPTHYDKTLTLQSKIRIRKLTELRFIFCFIARRMGYYLTDIGQYLNHMHHSSVIHGIQTFKTFYEIDPDFKIKYITIVNHIKQIHESQALEYLDQMESESEPNLLVRLLPEQNKSI
jgi:hypothetical protein